mgnify:CR=1 FL=1|tara:strand:- start:1793 stop:2449 length:657 start_codon:yes stop_codon:yes gene_type:complete
MPSSGYLIDGAGIKRLREDHEMLQKRVMQLEQRTPTHAGSSIRLTQEFAKVTKTIAPRDISTSALETILGSGKAELYKISMSATSDVVSFEKIMVDKTQKNPDGDAVEVDVYNSSLVPVAIDAYIHITRDFRSGFWMVDQVQTAVAQASAYGITARVGSTAGFGQAEVWYIDEGILSRTYSELKVYNMSATAITAGSFITIKRCSLDEDWIVDAEDCG